MRFTVVITPRTFGKVDSTPIDMLKEAGFELIQNPFDCILDEEKLIRLIPEAHGLIVGLDSVSERVLKQGARLKVISKYGVGTDNIDLSAATRLGIMVVNAPGTNSTSVAELSFGLMLNLARHISNSDRNIREGTWQSYQGFELTEKTLGIIGTGQIGKELALKASGFNMKLICYDIKKDEAWARQMGAIYLPMKEVLKKADIVSLHIPLLNSTHHIISAQELSAMKDNAILINTARGELIDETALFQALQNHQLAGAGLDVWETEPPVDSPLRELDNVILTSHIGAHTIEAAEAMGRLASQNLIQGLSGETPSFLVNPEAIRHRRL